MNFEKKYYPEWYMRVIRIETYLEKWRTLIDHLPKMEYNGIAYAVKRFAERVL